MLEIDKLSKTYHTKNEEILAIKDFSFNLKEGEFAAIIGPSGCGKSTILNILAELDTASNGAIKMKQDISIGYMLQQDALFEWRTILDNCLLGLELKKELNEENKKYVLNLLETYGLKDFINSYPNQLSGGMRQRVALIRTLATKPDLLLMDEPFCALDYCCRLAVSDDVYKIIKKENKTTIMVTHDIAEAISVADRIIIMSERPSKIKKILDIELTNRGTPIHNRKAKEFAEYYEKIWKELDYHV